MNDEQRKRQEYLGDGVYCEFDGFGYIIRANHHTDQQCTDKVYFELNVLKRFIDFSKRIQK